jgi:hypothetical protein
MEPVQMPLAPNPTLVCPLCEQTSVGNEADGIVVEPCDQCLRHLSGELGHESFCWIKYMRGRYQ